MSESDNEQDPRRDAERDVAEHERPEVGLVADEDLPDDLQPSDDNPLAKDPGEDEDSDGAPEEGTGKVDGMPDMGGPGAPG